MRKVKLIGIGNILLGDDAIGVYVTEKIKKDFVNLQKQISVIIGETDYIYCLNEINKDDVVIVIDSIYTNKNFGDVSVFNIKECEEFFLSNISAHEINLINALINEEKNVEAYLIGIEIKEINYSLELSETLKEKFSNICSEVTKNINMIINNIQEEEI